MVQGVPRLYHPLMISRWSKTIIIASGVSKLLYDLRVSQNFPQKVQGVSVFQYIQGESETL